MSEDEDDSFVSRTEVRFNAIYIIESLASGEFRSGQYLFDEVVSPDIRKLEGAYSEYSRVETEGDLRAKLRQIQARVRQYGHQPIIHFESHGYETGLALADGSQVEWTSLISELTAINVASRMNLLVVAMMCRGWNLMYSLLASDQAAICMLIAPPDNMTGGAILTATKRFYAAIVERLDLNHGLEAMNDNLPYAEWVIKPGLSEILVCRVFRSHLEGLTPLIISREENRRVAQQVRARGLDLKRTEMLRKHIRSHLLDHRARYERLRKRFLMLDLFPENAWRFGLTYEKCIKP